MPIPPWKAHGADCPRELCTRVSAIAPNGAPITCFSSLAVSIARLAWEQRSWSHQRQRSATVPGRSSCAGGNPVTSRRIALRKARSSSSSSAATPFASMRLLAAVARCLHPSRTRQRTYQVPERQKTLAMASRSSRCALVPQRADMVRHAQTREGLQGRTERPIPGRGPAAARHVRRPCRPTRPSGRGTRPPGEPSRGDRSADSPVFGR